MIDNHRHPVHIPSRSGAKVGNGTTAMVESTVRLLLKRRSDGPKGRGIAVKSDKISLPTRDAGFIDDLLDRWATAGVLGISVRTLDRWHRLGFGPPRIRYAGQIRYRLSSLARWVLSHETVPQSPASQGSKEKTYV